MVRGFIVSLDRDFRAGDYGRRYWRTINNGFVPYRMLAPVNYPEFQGVRLDDTRRLPIGYILSRRDAFYLRTESGRARRGGRLDFHHRVDIVDEATIGSHDYFVGADERLYRQDDVRRIVPSERPEQIGPNEKWIEVDLTSQSLIAYEGDRPVYATLVSSGRAFHPDDPEADFLTPTGMFRIRAKHLAATMDGDTAADGPYSIDDVPWVMYFQLAYALHGAFWHRAFGYPRSHGCVNLAPRDAQWVFNWSDPQVPRGWHGAYPTEDEPGTWIWIHGETPGSRS
ncbi:MAG TPA: L,D-transpeptidase [Sandaracinaceae bacterium LLY-WYZ-13_1]|nr:L,D-transpeptidase [Sandaracinaceae bacterium LLY-WYZ-13_1]